MVLLTIITVLLVLAILLFVDLRQGYKAYQKSSPLFHFNKKNAKYDLFTTGDTFFPSLFDDIDQAKLSIDVMFFIVRNDNISHQLYDALQQKAQQGVKVRFMVDWLGSLKLKKAIIQELKSSGVEFVYSHKPSFPYFFYKINRRNHRKITVIDDKVGYIGGFNVGKEYLGKDPKLGPWRDYHLRLTGEVVNNLKEVFDFDWNSATRGKTNQVRSTSKQSPTNESDRNMDIHATEAGQLENQLVDWINQAKSELLIGSPYFIPSKRMFDALLQAIKRGVEVKIIVPIKGDHPFVKPAGIPYMKKVKEAGGDVYLFDNGFYHAKVILIDEKFCDFGTANFDMRSVFFNKEINTMIHSDDNFIKEIRSAFFKDMKSCQPFTDQWVKQQPITTKLSGVLAWFIRPLL